MPSSLLLLFQPAVESKLEDRVPPPPKQNVWKWALQGLNKEPWILRYESIALGFAVSFPNWVFCLSRSFSLLRSLLPLSRLLGRGPQHCLSVSVS